MESSVESPQKARQNCHMISDTALGIYSKEHKTGYSRDICTPVFITALSTIAKLWKQPRYLTTDEWIVKL
jgi:hypothetical protein